VRTFLRYLLSLSMLALLLLAGCDGDRQPVAEVATETRELVLPHGRFASLDVLWRLREPLAGRSDQLFVFVHLLDGPGSVLRTFDYAWPDGWQAGSSVRHRVSLHQSSLGPPLEPGSYSLSLGLYDGEGHRWPLLTRGDPVDRYEYHIADVRVPAETGGEPMFSFSPEWLDSELGRDRQVLARRWLAGSGHLRVGEIDQAGAVWLRLLLPSPTEQQELVLAEGATQQGAVVRADCGVVEVELAGVGHHEVVLPISPPAEGDSCTIEIEPDFYLLELESGARRTLSLDGLAWAPGTSRRSASAE
jgi:hypothetical protein